VYRAQKNHQLLSLVLIKIVSKNKKVIDAKQRSIFARYLMDSCRCRDIVGHYERSLFAIIFPQTPTEGAKIAIGRVKEGFYEKFSSDDYKWEVSIATCPDNGSNSEELMIMAEDSMRALKKSNDDLVVGSEGKPSYLYFKYVTYVRHPVSQTLHSPFKMALVFIVLIFGIYALFKVNNNKYSQWNVVMEQVLNESEVFPEWEWGREGSEGFKLEPVDGYISNSNEFILEHFSKSWFSFPLVKSDRIKLTFDLMLSELIQLKISFGKMNLGNLELTFYNDRLEISQSSAILYFVPYESIVALKSHIEIELGKNDLRIVQNGEELLKTSWVPERSLNDDRIYFQCQNGYAFVSELKLLGKYDEVTIEIPSDDQLVRIMGMDLDAKLNYLKTLKPKDKAVVALWKDVTQEIYSKLEKEDRRDSKWISQLSEVQYKNNENDFWYGLIPRLNEEELIELGRAIKTDLLNFDGVKSCLWFLEQKEEELTKELIIHELNKISDVRVKALCTKMLYYRSSEKSGLDLQYWLWDESIYNFRENDEVYLKLYLDFFKNRAHLYSREVLKSHLSEMLRLAVKDNLAVFEVLSVFLAKIDNEMRDSFFEKSMLLNDTTLLLLNLKYLPEGESKIECAERLSLDIGKTYFGKLIRYEWLWYVVKGTERITYEEEAMLEELSLQSRRPKLAAEALKVLESF